MPMHQQDRNALLERLRRRNLMDRLDSRQAPPSPPEEPPKASFLDRLSQFTIEPLKEIGGAALTSLIPTTSKEGIKRQLDANKLLMDIPGQLLGAQRDIIRLGADKIGSVIEPGTATTRLTARSEEGRDITGFPQERGVTTGELVMRAISGTQDIIAGGIPFGAAARVPGHDVEEGNLAGALGGLTGLAVPRVASGALGRIKRSVADPGTIDFELPSGERVPVPVTRGETGGVVPRTLERIARGSELANKPFKKFDAKRTDILIDDIATKIVEEISRDPKTISGAGASFERAIRKGQEILKEQAGDNIGISEAAVAELGIEISPVQFRTFMRKELVRREAAMKEAKFKGDAVAVAELRSGAADFTSSLLEDIPPELRGRFEAALGGQGISAGAIKPMPADAAFTVLKNIRALARRVPGRDPGIQGGALKRAAGLLGDDIVASIKAVDPQLARDWKVANRQFFKATKRLQSETFQKMFKANSEKVPGVLEKVDVREINGLRAAAGAEKFEAAAGRLLEQNLERSIKGEQPSSFTEGPFKVQRQIRAGPFRSFVEKMQEAGRGVAIYGKNTMRALNDLASVLDRVDKTTSVGGGASIVGHMVDAAATFRLAVPVAAGIAGTLMGGVSGGLIATAAMATAQVAPAVLLRLAARVIVKPKGASIMKNFIRFHAEPAKLSFWAARLGDYIDDDPELRALLAEGNER